MSPIMLNQLISSYIAALMGALRARHDSKVAGHCLLCSGNHVAAALGVHCHGFLQKSVHAL